MTPDTPSPEFLALQRALAGRYSIDRELGRGGMGIVFLAREVALDRPVAIKLLPPELSREPALRARFLREARTAAGLSHPHIVPIHSVEEQGNLVFFTMAWIDGETLGQRVRRAGPVSPRELLRIIQEIAWALGHAHAHGVIHRDIKPDNVLLERDSGRALVTDFGIAVSDRAGDGEVTVQGTPRYMAPEQAFGEAATVGSDLYSLAVTALYGGAGPLGEGRLPMVSEAIPGLPPRVAALLDACLAVDPDLRPASAELVASAAAAARAEMVEAPAPVRAFVREHDQAGVEIGMGATATGAAMGLYLLNANDLFGAIVFMTAGVVLAGLTLGRFGHVAMGLRTLRAQGFDFATLRRGLELEQRRRLEEDTESVCDRQARLRRAGWYGVLGVVKTATAVWMAQANLPVAINFLGAAFAVALPAFTLRMVWVEYRRGRRALWQRFLASRPMALLYRALGAGTGQTPPPVSACEPTALALGREIDRLFAMLPARTRTELAEVPHLIARLEADAVALARTDRPGNGTDPRLRTTVAALEHLRLQLLQVSAGTASRDELTQDLDQARRIAGRVEGLLAVEVASGAVTPRP